MKPDDIERKAQALFGGWPRGEVPAPVSITAANAAATTIVLVDKPGAAQSSFRLGGIGAPRTTAWQYPALTPTWRKATRGYSSCAPSGPLSAAR